MPKFTRKPKREKSLHELRIIALRRASIRWKYKYQCLNEAKILIDEGQFKNGKDKLGVYFICAHCLAAGDVKFYHKRDEVQVDHIAPVIDTEDGFVGWDTFVPNLFCEIDNLQVLCKPHHKIKTATETAERHANKSLDTASQKGYNNSIRTKKGYNAK